MLCCSVYGVVAIICLFARCVYPLDIPHALSDTQLWNADADLFFRAQLTGLLFREIDRYCQSLHARFGRVSFDVQAVQFSFSYCFLFLGFLVFSF